MLVISRDSGWIERARRLAAFRGWPFEARPELAETPRSPSSERVLILVDRALARPAALGRLRELHPSARVALACGDAELGSGGFAAVLSSGADEAVAKSWSDERLLSRLSALREAALSSAVRVSADDGLKAERRSRRALVRARGRWKSLELPAAEFAVLWELLAEEGAAVSRERLLAVLRSETGREVGPEAVSRRVLSLRRVLAGWKGRVESVRGGFYRLVSMSGDV